jgi:hypothetical protein
MDLISNKNRMKDSGVEGNGMIRKKLENYVKRNTDGMTKEKDIKFGEMKENIYIVNKMKDW